MNSFKRVLSMALALIMIIGIVPAGVFAQEPAPQPDATTSATYYTKPNWEARIRDKSRWKVEDSQTLVRVTTSDPVEMNDIDYDGMYINANGRYVIRLIYKEKTQAVSAVWHRALINFGDLDQYIDFGNSYVFGRDGKTRYTFDPVTGIKGRGFDLRSAVGDRTNNRKNLPINLVLKDGVDFTTLGKKNYIIQMRLTDADYKRVYSYAPKKSSMDYSTYTKTTSVSLEDNLNNLFIKGGLQQDSNNATNQEFFMSEFIANPDQYKDEKNLGIIRTQYMGQRAGSAATPTIDGRKIAFTQVFDANLLNYLKPDEKGNVGYVNVLTDVREVSPYSKNFGFKKEDINRIKVGDKELAYVVIAPSQFTSKNDVKVVGIPQHDQYTMLSGIYITAIDYVVDKSQFENTFSSKYTRKLDYSTMSGWTNPNDKGWPVYTIKFPGDYVVQEGDSFTVDAGADAKGKQIMLQIGGEQAILRRPQGYYNGYNFSKAALDNFKEIADGVFQFTIGEGTTVKDGKPLKVYMPYTDLTDAPEKINFLQIHNGTKLNEGAANLTLQKDRNINMHLYKQGKKGYFVLKYTLKDETEVKSLKFTPNVFWTYKDNDKVLTGASNTTTGVTGGNFYINTKKLKPGTDIIVESYDNKDNKIESETSWFKYIPLDKSAETVKLITWTDHSDKRSVLSINKSLYTPYQVLFTNDYADGTDDFYVNPRVLPEEGKDFNTDTTKIVGYTKYDSGKVRTLYEGDKLLFGKVEADGNEYDKDGNLVGQDVRKEITIAKKDIFDAQFTEDSKKYKAYEYKVDLTKMLPYHSDDKTETPLTLLKDMKFVSTASDGSSLPSDLIETRVRARVLFDTTEGAWEDGTKKAVKIVPDNVKFYGETGYTANGFEGEGADTNTGDKFPEAPKLEGKNFLGWVTEAGKTALQNKTTASVDAFNALPKEQVFTNTTPVTKHLVVYAIYSEDTVVTLDANGGVFKDGEGQITKKPGELAGIEAPTKNGFTFKGWADTKDATEVNVADPSKLTESKTVYAVWEKDEAKKLDLKAPENPVPVSDKTDLTAKEKDAVKQAVIDANPTLNLTKDDITVGSDGKVTVTKGDKTGELTPDQTVKQKEVINNINPPKKPVEVKNKEALTEEENGKVKDAIIKANPDLNLKPEEVEVDEKGNVTINQGGKTGTVPAEKTVVEENKIIKLTPPDKVEVKDVNNLTPTEKEAVKKAVMDKNPGLTEDKITVDGNGNVTVTDGDNKGELAGTDTVKPFDRTNKTLNKDIELTEVSDKNNLTEAEKEAVKEAVKAANPDLNFKDEEIEVANDGTVKVPMGTNPDGTTKYETIDKSKTVREDDKNKTISLKAPKKTKVADASKLTEAEKKAVIAAVKEANKNLPADAKIEVADDGSVTVTSGTEPNQKVGLLSQKDTVEEILKAPVVSAEKDGSITVKPADDQAKEIAVTYKDPQGNEKTVTATKGSDGKWTLPEGTDKDITVDEITGEITLPSDKVKNGEEVKAVAKDGTRTSEEASTNAKDETAPEAPKVEAKDDGSVEITPPTDKDTKTVTVTFTDPKGNEKTVTATKGDDGTWSINPTDVGATVDPTTGVITIPKDKVKAGTEVSAKAKDGNNNESTDAGKATAKYVIKAPDEPIKVDNSKALSEGDKEKVKQAVENANKDGSGNSTLPEDGTIDVADDGTVTIKDKNGNVVGTITPDKTVKQDETKLPVKAPIPVAVKDPSNLTPEEKAAIKKAVKDANPTLQDGDIVVNDDGSVTVKKDGKETTIGKDKTITTDVKTPKLTEVEDPSSLKDEEKAAVKKAVEDANKDGSGNSTLPEGASIDVADDGTVTIKDNTGKTIATIPASDVVKQKSGTSDELNDPSKVAVKDPLNLTPEEKQAIKDAVKKANPTLQDSEIVVNDDGSVTVKKDGKETTIGKDKTITTDVKTPKLTEVEDPSSLKDEEKAAVKKAVEDANKDGSGNSTLPEGASIDVADDGTVTIKDNTGKTIATIPASDAVTRKGGEKLADQYTPAYTEADAQAGSPTTITGPNFKKGAQDVSKPDGTTFELGDGAPTDASIDKDTGKITYTPTDADAGKKVTIPVVVKYSDGSSETVEAKVQVVVQAPATPLTVANSKALSDEDKKNVKEAVRNANPGLSADATIDVADDGAVTVKDKDGEVIGEIPASKTVKQDETKLPVKAPTPVEVKDPNNVSEEEQGKIKKAIIKANPDLHLTDDDITVDNKGKATIKKGNKTQELTPAQTVTQSTPGGGSQGPDVKAPTPVEVNDPNHLTPAEKAAVEDAVRKANPNLPSNAQIDVADDGTVTVTIGNKRTDLPRSKTVTRKTGRPDASDHNDGRIIFWGINPFRRAEEPKKEKEVKETFTHKAYISGYPDGTVRPMGNITRAEAATMIARLLEIEDTASPAKPAFTDTPSEWYNKYINAAVEKGLMKGYPEGTFKPNAPITRAEFTYMISIIDKKDKGAVPFADVKGHWAEDAIGREFAAGRIAGYPDGSFRPDANITRAEAAKILNRVFERSYDDKSTEKSEDTVRIKMFSDLPTDFWGYDDMIEATNTHVLTRRVKGQVAEDWSDINR